MDGPRKSDLAALKLFEKGRSFVIAAYLLDPHLAEAQSHILKPLRKRRYLIGPLPVSGYQVPAKALDGRHMCEVLFGNTETPGLTSLRLARMAIVLARRMERNLPFAYDPDVKVALRAKKKDGPGLSRYALERIMLVTKRYACMTGRPIDLYDEHWGVRDPRPCKLGGINILIGSQPPGEHGGTVTRGSLFGLPLSPRLELNFWSGAKGRGHLIEVEEDGVRTPVAQIVQGNVYIFFSAIGRYWEPATPLVYGHILAKVEEALRKGAPDIEHIEMAHQLIAKQSEEDAFEELWRDMVIAGPEHYQVQAQQTMEEIMQAQKLLHGLYVLLREHQANARRLQSDRAFVDTFRRLPEDLAKIRAMPEVGHVALADEGMNIHLKPIVMAWEGERYALGRFVIRFSKFGVVSVWCEESTHPYRVPHPHINKDGTWCFGNVTDAIAKASAELRLATATTYLIAWLTKGYDPSLALTKLETWPKVEEA